MVFSKLIFIKVITNNKKNVRKIHQNNKKETESKKPIIFSTKKIINRSDEMSDTDCGIENNPNKLRECERLHKIILDQLD